ncbi:hypothetical protein [Nonomuraea rosea]
MASRSQRAEAVRRQARERLVAVLGGEFDAERVLPPETLAPVQAVPAAGPGAECRAARAGMKRRRQGQEAVGPALRAA